MHYGIRWFKCKLKPPKNKQSMKSRNELKQPPTKTKKKFAQIFFQ